MIAAWMIYAVFVGTFVAIAARAVEVLARWAKVPSRWIWTSAMALTVVLGVRALLRPIPSAGATADVVARTISSRGPMHHDGVWRSMLQLGARIGSAVLDGPVSIQTLVARNVPGLSNTHVVAIWLATTAVLGVLFLAVYARVQRAQSGWPRTQIHGVPVSVAPAIGPMVVGIRRPDVVVPRWLLDRDEREQRLVVAHEGEHVRARDPLLLVSACCASLLAPWHVALWYMLSRLRLAIEVDCDARVLRAGAAVAPYGALLIDVAERVSPLRMSALALAGNSSHLHQRILAMDSRLPRFALARRALAGTLALASLLAACEATLPTTTGIEPTPAADAARQLSRSIRVDSGAPSFYVGNVKVTRFWVDGVQRTAAEVLAIDTLRLASMKVRKDPDGQSAVLITLTPRRRGSASAPFAQALGASGHIAFFINGVESDSATVKALDRDSILSVEVIKGPSMQALYPGKNYTGVVQVTMKGTKPPD